jgi:uncharacterized protein (TIGR02453 family)
MNATPGFSGFHKQTLIFFRNLAKNNDKLWFDSHREEYEKFVVAPARDFVLALGDKLKKISPGVHADPRVNKSLFRINRDTRFSHDKTPYKTHLGIWFWEGTRPRMECSGFYFHLEPGRLMLGVGLYMFPKELLDLFRQSVVHPRHGPLLTKAVAAIRKKKDYFLGNPSYKKTPPGYDPHHPNAEFLLYNGLHAGVELPILPEVVTSGLVDLCFNHYKALLPLHTWLLALTNRT